MKWEGVTSKTSEKRNKDKSQNLRRIKCPQARSKAPASKRQAKSQNKKLRSRIGHGSLATRSVNSCSCTIWQKVNQIVIRSCACQKNYILARTRYTNGFGIPNRNKIRIMQIYWPYKTDEWTCRLSILSTRMGVAGHLRHSKSALPWSCTRRMKTRRRNLKV